MPEHAPRPTRFDVVHGLEADQRTRAPGERSVTRAELWIALVSPLAFAGVLAVAGLGMPESGPASVAALAVTGAVLLVSLLREVLERDLRGIWRWLPFLAAPFLYDRPLSLAGMLGIRQLVMSLRTVARHRRGREVFEYLWVHPVEFLAVGFAATIAVGTVLLMLPAASVVERGVSFVDALFTSTSATCVTGLTVVDTATVFTTFGKVVIVGLIQVGGIGVMALSTLAAVVAGRRLGLAQSGAVAASMETTTPIDAVRIVRVIAGATLLTEGVGALILTLSFLPDMPAHRAAGFGAFHAISAFCNAGFGLWTTNLEPCNTDLPVVLTIAFLIILGGIGFLVLAELAGWLTSRRRRRRPLTLHTRIVLATTGILLLAGTILFALLEWHGALGRLDWPWKLVNAFFQAVTPRTAGFNTVPMAGLAGATVLVLIVLMFIGASPGSTGGGIKTSTAAVILFAIRAFVRGREHVEVGGRTVSSPTVVRAVVLVALSAAVVVVGLFLLLLTQSVPFHSLFFETVSAFGTVGLSIGATSQVDDAGKLVLVAVMYVGRVGPLTLILLLGGGAAVPVRYPEEPVALS